jgi:hypothetical protein
MMANSLFAFIFNTIQKRANNPANPHFWLPGKIAGVKKSGGENLFPLQGTDWDIGAINNPELTVYMGDQWGQYLSRNHAPTKEEYEARHTVIPCPDRPCANLSFPEITVDGLANLFLLGNPEITGSRDGYQTKISLKFDEYDGQNGRPHLPGLSLRGQYRIVQCLCTADKTVPHPTQCDGWQKIAINGSGTILASFAQAYVDADLQITVRGAGRTRKLQVVLTRLKVRGATADTWPEFILDPENGLTIESRMWIAQSMWLVWAKTAIEAAEGQQGIFQQLNTSLNQPRYLESLSQLFTAQLDRMTDSVLGPIPDGSLPDESGASSGNPVDRYLFDRIRIALNNPGCEWFLPEVIRNFPHPSLEPLTIEEIALPDQKITLMGAEMRFTQIKFTGITLTGVSNLSAPPAQLTFNGADIEVLLNLSVLNPPPSVRTPSGMQPVPPPPLVAAGNFTMLPEGETDPLTGAFGLQIQSSNVRMTFRLSGTEVADLKIKVTRLQWETDPEKMALTLRIDSVFRKSIEQMVNRPELKRRIVAELNAALLPKLDEIGNTATSAAQKTITARLDG